uniref:Uncharacterized protein n=1 Tax=Rhizophora mucronata TaxID=61149 RepID=A0A2P2JE66_RHIMU
MISGRTLLFPTAAPPIPQPLRWVTRQVSTHRAVVTH